MTYAGGDEEEGLLAVTDDLIGDYVKLKDVDDRGGGDVDGGTHKEIGEIGEVSSYASSSSASFISTCYSNWWWAKLLLLVILLGALVAVFLKWIEPFFMEKVIQGYMKLIQEWFEKTTPHVIKEGLQTRQNMQ